MKPDLIHGAGVVHNSTNQYHHQYDSSGGFGIGQTPSASLSSMMTSSHQPAPPVSMLFSSVLE